LKTPSLSSEYQVWRDGDALYVQVGPTRLSYQARADDNPVCGYHGPREGYRRRFANYVAPVLERLGLAELEHRPRNNRVRAT
jgi:hypothetical protein